MDSLGCRNEQILGLVSEETDPGHSRTEGLALIYRHQLMPLSCPTIINFINRPDINLSLLKESVRKSRNCSHYTSAPPRPIHTLLPCWQDCQHQESICTTRSAGKMSFLPDQQMQWTVKLRVRTCAFKDKEHSAWQPADLHL